MTNWHLRGKRKGSSKGPICGKDAPVLVEETTSAQLTAQKLHWYCSSLQSTAKRQNLMENQVFPDLRFEEPAAVNSEGASTDPDL